MTLQFLCSQLPLSSCIASQNTFLLLLLIYAKKKEN